MSKLRVNVPGKPVRFLDLGPAIGRISDWDIVRKHLDVALAEPRRRRPLPIELRQP